MSSLSFIIKDALLCDMNVMIIYNRQIVIAKSQFSMDEYVNTDVE